MGPFEPQTFSRRMYEILVLSALSESAKHGYRIARDLRRDSQGLFVLKHGTLYPILGRLERRGLVLGEWLSEGRRRKVYSLTAAGRRYIVEQADRMQKVVDYLVACADSSRYAGLKPVRAHRSLQQTTAARTAPGAH